MKYSATVSFIMAAMVAVLVNSQAEAGGPGDGIQVGPAVLRPYLDASVLFDDNVTVAPSAEQDDTSIIAQLGLGFDANTDMLRVLGDIWLLSETYSDLSDEDHDDIGNSLSIGIGRLDGVNVRLEQMFADIEALDYATGKVEPQTLMSLAAEVGIPLTDKLSAAIRASYEETDYETTYFDWDETAGSIELAHKVTDKTAVTVTGVAGVQSSTGLDEDTDFVKARVGVQNDRTAKVSGKAGIGFQSFSSGNNDIDGVSLLVSAQWRCTEKVVLALGAENTVEPGTLATERNNNKDVTSAVLTAQWAVNEALVATVQGQFTRNDFDQQVESRDKEEDTVGVSVRVDYTAPAKFVKLYAMLEQLDRDSTFDGNDFGQMTAQAGVRLQY